MIIAVHHTQCPPAFRPENSAEWYINSFIKQNTNEILKGGVNMNDRTNPDEKALAKELQMVNREYDEKIDKPDDINSKNKKRSKNPAKG